MDRQLAVKTVDHNAFRRHIKRRGLHAGGDFAYRNAIPGVCDITACICSQHVAGNCRRGVLRRVCDRRLR
ncbi:hypothetical protein U5T60_18780, partial [Klebsiella quasipneumoniae subsp. quasipneumoniae]|uniref:hypothetical protein n=1 Tax=Klebsiella quasipneumoniae TaxID=1463165 RepID=UPI0030145E92